MIAIGNGLFAYGSFIPFTATFLNFIEYGFPAVRLAALSRMQQLLIMTHDSIGLGTFTFTRALRERRLLSPRFD